ncbi:uncharacterized protein LOC144574409 [Carex rostrata]
MTMNMTTPFKFLELYVVANPTQIPRQNSRQNTRQLLQLTQGLGLEQSVAGPSRAPSVAGPSRAPSIAGPSRVQSDRGRSPIPSSSFSRVQSERDRSETPERLYYAYNTDEDPEEREAGANWDDNGNGGVSDHSDEDTGIPVLGRRKWSLLGRGERHPFEQFNDTSGFEEVDSSFFATCEGKRHELSEGMTYDSKDKMKYAINHWHIKENREIKNTHSDTTRLRYKCVSARCRWALVARATGLVILRPSRRMWLSTHATHQHPG